MPDFRLPLGGDVTQTIAPWTGFFSNLGNSFSLLALGRGQGHARSDASRSTARRQGQKDDDSGRIDSRAGAC